MNLVKGRHDESRAGKSSHNSDGQGVTQEEYFKIYSNAISWPKLEPMPGADTHYFYHLEYIQEHQGTLTFDLEINKRSVSGSTYGLSMLPQIRLDSVSDVQPTSFTMDCTIKFRGEPIKTTYGFCWSKSTNPTVRDSNYTLSHRECYRGHAIGLNPGTTYYVRSFATNGLGYRYSDEELESER